MPRNQAEAGIRTAGLSYVPSGRRLAGRAHMSLTHTNPPTMMRVTEMSAGKVPLEVAKALDGKEFKSFDQFRKTFWKEMANSSYAKEFGEVNFANMKKGVAPDSHPTQWAGSRKSFELHHRTPITQGGSVYDVSNILIVTPKYHLEILNKEFHFGGR